MGARRSRFIAATAFAGLSAVSLVTAQDGSLAAAQDGAPFKAAVELVNVTATVTDSEGRFVPDLTQDDFAVFEDGRPQEIAYFSSERVPVSLGILLDVSGSMTEDKMAAARDAIDRFVFDLLGPDDELFFMEFATRARLLQDWTHDKAAISRAMRRITATGGTAMYDAIADALPIAARGGNRKKAILVITDGNDTSSATRPGQVREMIRESEVLVYALGVDGTAPPTRVLPRSPQPRGPIPFPIPRPGGPFGPGRPLGPGGIRLPFPQIVGGGRRWPGPAGFGVNADALHLVTDDTGGRTEVVRGFGDLDTATTRIADELSRQYSLGYVSPGKHDGQWHTIRVSIRNRDLTVRARRGYIAS